MLLISGLDSILAGRLLKEQKVELEALFFHTPFCPCSPLDSGCKMIFKLNEITTKYLSLSLTVQDLGEDYLAIIKKPRFGYGKNMNPCIDCKIYMFKKAREYMEKKGLSFLITGEVLGERPMSQNRNALMLIEREAHLEGYVLRPLSAKLLPKTVPEIQGWVDREKLLSIRGRSRRTQLNLAEKFGIQDFPQPAGGCLLTDPGFSRRLKNFISVDFNIHDVNILKLGRHFKLYDDLYLIMGRNEKENIALERLYSQNRHLLLKPVNAKGPSGIGIGNFHSREKLLAEILACYCKVKHDTGIDIEVRHNNTVWIYNILPQEKGVYADFLV